MWHHARLASGTLLTWWELACGAPRVHQLQVSSSPLPVADEHLITTGLPKGAHMT